MRLNSTTLGITILVIFFGGLSIASAQGWWQTQGGNQQNRGHGSETSGDPLPAVSLHGIVKSYDSTLLELTADDGQILTVEVGNARYNQSIGFAPQLGEGATVRGFFDENGLFSALTITLDTGQAYAFRDETGYTLWSGGNGQGNGGNH
jgi:hypothetical protein